MIGYLLTPRRGGRGCFLKDEWVKEWARDIITNNMNGASINLTNHYWSIDLGKTKSFPSSQMSLRSSCNSNCWSQNIWKHYEKAKHVNNIITGMIQYDTNCLIHVQTVHNKHSEMASSNTFQQIQYLSTKHQLRRQVFKNILAMHRKQMRFHKTKSVDETEDLKEECCEFRKEVCFESYTMFGSLFT